MVLNDLANVRRDDGTQYLPQCSQAYGACSVCDSSIQTASRSKYRITHGIAVEGAENLARVNRELLFISIVPRPTTPA